MAIVEQHIFVGGMSCNACASRIERRLVAEPGVTAAKASFFKREVRVSYDNSVLRPKQIRALIESLGYQQLKARERSLSARQFAGIVLGIVAVWVLVSSIGQSTLIPDFPLASEQAGLGALFVVGLLTSFHCVGMCGGINLSQCIPAAAAKAGNSSSPTVPRKALATIVPSLQYNLGRVAAYTLVGALVGALGSVIVFNGYMRGAVQLAAGVFMVLMSLGMMGILPGLSALGLRLPAPVSRLLGKLPLDGKSPLFVGLLTGLMPCGPLQAMQLFALGSGSAANGALAMLAFAAGTLPLMLGLGGLASALSARFAKRVMTVGACMVMLFGLLMFSSGWSLSGLPDVSALGREHLGHLAAFVAPGAGGGGGQAGDSAGSGGAGDSSASGSAGGSGGSAANSAGSGTSGSASAGTAGGATGGASGTPAGSAPAENGEQVVRSTLQRGSYPAITVSAGTPVRWLIEADARNINGCNNRFVADAFKLEHKFTPGENVVLFTPEKPGTYTYTCWMGMIRGTITVV